MVINRARRYKSFRSSPYFSWPYLTKYMLVSIVFPRDLYTLIAKEKHSSSDHEYRLRPTLIAFSNTIKKSIGSDDDNKTMSESSRLVGRDSRGIVEDSYDSDSSRTIEVNRRDSLITLE